MQGWTARVGMELQEKEKDRKCSGKLFWKNPKKNERSLLTLDFKSSTSEIKGKHTAGTEIQYIVKFLNFMAPFYWWGSAVTRLQSHYVGSLLFTTKSQKVLVLIWLISEVWKTESTLEPPNGFELGAPGLESSALTTCKGKKNCWCRHLYNIQERLHKNHIGIAREPARIIKKVTQFGQFRLRYTKVISNNNK